MPWQRAWQTAGSQSSRSSRWEGAVGSELLLIIIHMDSTAAASIGKVVGFQCLLCTTVCLHLTSSVLQ